MLDPEEWDLYGWVAAAGKDGVAWIKPKAPACPDILDEATLIEMSRLDYLVCYGDSEIEVLASRIDPGPGDDTPCLSVGADACTVEPAWMNAPIWLGLDVGGGETSGLRAVAAPDVYERAAAMPEYTPVVLTLAADQPEARECRFLDSAGDDLVPPGQAALTCRMEFVVLDLAWDETDVGVDTEPIYEPVADAMAVVNVDYIEAWSAPIRGAGLEAAVCAQPGHVRVRGRRTDREGRRDLVRDPPGGPASGAVRLGQRERRRGSRPAAHAHRLSEPR